MRKLAHLSDLHFGATDARAVETLRTSLLDFRPDLIVVTGDLTQRARAAQFEAARGFLAELPFPQVVVPGNHDVAPVYRPWLRLTDPYRNYRRFVSHDLDPEYADDELVVLGLNTTHPTRAVEGRVSRRQVARVQARARAYPDRFHVLATHHPLLSIEERPIQHRVRRARPLLRWVAEANFDLMLSGHLHESYHGPTAAWVGAEHSLLVVQSSTATSTRLRGHKNAYNRITIMPPRIRIEVTSWEQDMWGIERTVTYLREEKRWRLEPVGE